MREELRRPGARHERGVTRLAAQVITLGVAVADGFVTPQRVRHLIDCAARRSERGDFHPARVGADRGLERRAEIRGDSICWLADPVLPAEQALLQDLDALRRALNRAALLGLFELEAHYASYPPGAGYARHVDQLQGRDERVVSLILYLNAAWHATAGGQLRLFDLHGGHRDVEPVAGRLVCFLASAREHAVLPTLEPRLSIAGWFRRRPMGSSREGGGLNGIPP